jgi:hypothetical protein
MPRPPVIDVVAQTPVSAAKIERFQDVEVGRVFDESGSIARSRVEVDDGAIGGIPGIDGREETTHEALIGARLTKCYAIGKRFPSGNV